MTSPFTVKDVQAETAQEMMSTSSVTDVNDGSPVDDEGSLDVSCSLVIRDYDSMLPCHFVRYPHA